MRKSKIFILLGTTFGVIVVAATGVSSRALAGADSGAAATGCDAKMATAFTKINSAWTEYAHGALKYFNASFRMLNQGFTSGPETALCHFIEDMGMNPNLNALPQEITKSFTGTGGAMNVKLTVVAPTESWATTLGYAAKATVTLNDTSMMVLYWGGTGESSKGFMIQKAAGFNPNMKNPMYIQWDRTDSANQFVKVFGAMFTTSYLGTTSYSSSSSGPDGDKAIYGYATYNASTKAVTTYSILAERQRQGGDSSQFGCFKMFATGTKGGTMKIAKTDDARGGTGHVSAGLTSVDSTQMDAVELVDATTTANLTGSTNDLTFVSFGTGIHCNKVLNAGQTGNAFAGNDSDLTKSPTDIF